MRVEILSTGTELMRGRSFDTNFPWLAAELQRRGHEVRFHATVGDDLEALLEAIRTACHRSALVLLTGGLGPTDDDLTREAAAIAFDAPLEFHPELFRILRERFRRRRVRMAAIHRRQAFLPRGAWALRNDHGSAPGFRIERGGVRFYALPGVPSEMKTMFLQEVVPGLPRGRPQASLDLRLFGMPESDVDEIVAPIVRREREASYGLTVSEGLVTIAVRIAGPLRREIRSRLRTRLLRALGPSVLGEGGITLPQAVASLLLRHRATIAVAESCTGGRVAHRLTEIPGISRVLLDAVVAYADTSKTARLGVPESLLRRTGAVSAPVARAMAEGVSRSSGARIGVSTTGIAGPTGGTKSKPVGLVYVAVSDRGSTEVRKFLLAGDRRQVMERAANAALDRVRRIWVK